MARDVRKNRTRRPSCRSRRSERRFDLVALQEPVFRMVGDDRLNRQRAARDLAAGIASCPMRALQRRNDSVRLYDRGAEELLALRFSGIAEREPIPRERLGHLLSEEFCVASCELMLGHRSPLT